MTSLKNSSMEGILTLSGPWREDLKNQLQRYCCIWKDTPEGGNNTLDEYSLTPIKDNIIEHFY